ncbi:MAG: Gfo/Idh/MocA family oxidoreductase [Lachnospiraceae bacterium]|nr:Gfo/Idh/MocA family oxidoreductase [Lachnospiraceae bacterium]
MKIYNIAVVGCGQMGEAHIEHIYYKPNVRVACVCDRDIERARFFAHKYNAASIETDAQKCISREDVDIVIIATYPSSHLELLKLCIEYKKHVICEKPITTTLEDGEEFVRLVKENPQVKVLVGHILRHNETYNRVAKMIQEGAIGHPIIMRMSQNHHTLNWPRYLNLIKETSPIIDCGVHYFDVMQWFTGAKITSVSGIGMRTDSDIPEGKHNYEMITAHLSDGSIGFYEAGWTKTISSDNMKEFVGPKGSIRIVYRKDRHTHQEEGDLIEYYCLEDNSYRTINVVAERKPTGLQLDYLIKMIEEDVPAFPSIDNVFDSFKVALDAEEFIRKNNQ